jgi:hypothetical protein
MEIKSIAEYQKKGIGEIIKDQFTLAWYFDKFWEKAVLVILCLLGVVRIIQWIILK